MENEGVTPQKSGLKILPIAITIAVVVTIIVGAVMFASNNKQNQETQTFSPTPQNEAQTQPPVVEDMGLSYRDGVYDAVGNYTSPGGEESINVTLTLDEGVVTDASVVSNATRPISKQMQAAFISGFKEQVVGKKISEINVTKVSTSSLTPKGFNDAVEKIKTQAQA